MNSCGSCHGFIPHGQQRCPHCDTQAPSLAKKVVQLAAGGAMAMTLMACYGAMPQRYQEPPQPAEEVQPKEAPAPEMVQAEDASPDKGQCDDPAMDTDKDGYCGPQDCDETNAAVHPGAEDPPGDEIDQNCDGHDG